MSLNFIVVLVGMLLVIAVLNRRHEYRRRVEMWEEIMALAIEMSRAKVVYEDPTFQKALHDLTACMAKASMTSHVYRSSLKSSKESVVVSLDALRKEMDHLWPTVY